MDLASAVAYIAEQIELAAESGYDEDLHAALNAITGAILTLQDQVSTLQAQVVALQTPAPSDDSTPA